LSCYGDDGTDVKARNILVNKEGDCKLADFGVSKDLERKGEAAVRTLLTITIHSFILSFIAYVECLIGE
jgi:serine/threonine protein kinase